MKITFFFNYLNHHQVLVADEMYKKLKDDFCFVATFPRDLTQLKGGQDYSNRPYCIMVTESNEKAYKLNIDSEICVYGAGNLGWMKERSSTGKLSFEVSERWLKRGWISIFSPRLVKWLCLYKTHLESKPFYKLCCSAFAAYDDNKLDCYKGRHFKWGYFTAVDENLEDEMFKQDVSILESTPLMWCTRFLKLTWFLSRETYLMPRFCQR